MNKNVLFITRAALIAAFYVVLGAVSNIVGLDSGAVQLRLSEALCVLPAISGASVWGVTIGCFIFNTLYTGNVLDMIFGTMATLIGALFATRFKKHKYLAFIPTVVANAIIIPFVICFGTMDGDMTAIPFMILTVGAGELVSCGLFGNLLLRAIGTRKILR